MYRFLDKLWAEIVVLELELLKKITNYFSKDKNKSSLNIEFDLFFVGNPLSNLLSLSW